jgi:hypothetical protein
MYNLPSFLTGCRHLCGPAQNTGNVRVYIKICQGAKRVILELLTLPYEPNIISYTTTSYPRHFACRGPCWSRKAKFTWTAPLKIRINGISNSINLPQSIMVPKILGSTTRALSQAYALDKAMVTFHLLFRYHGEKHYLEIPGIGPISTMRGAQPPIHFLLPIQRTSPNINNNLTTPSNYATTPSNQKQKSPKRSASESGSDIFQSPPIIIRGIEKLTRAGIEEIRPRDTEQGTPRNNTNLIITERSPSRGQALRPLASPKSPGPTIRFISNLKAEGGYNVAFK